MQLNNVKAGNLGDNPTDYLFSSLFFCGCLKFLFVDYIMNENDKRTLKCYQHVLHQLMLQTEI